MDTPDQNPSWAAKKIDDLNTHIQFDYRSPLPPDQCFERLEDKFEEPPYYLQVIVEARDADSFYFHIMEYSLIGIQIEGNVTSLGKGSLVDGRIIRPGCALTIVLVYVIIPLVVIGTGMFFWAIITRNTDLIGNAVNMTVLGACLGVLFAWYSQRYKNYLSIMETAIKTVKLKNSDKHIDT